MSKKKGKSYTDQELLDKLVEIAEKEEKTPTEPILNSKNNDYPTTMTYANHFGSLNKAKKKVGLPVNEKVKYTEEELISIIQSWIMEFGCEPKERDFRNCDVVPMPNTYRNRFESFSKAIEIAKEEME